VTAVTSAGQKQVMMFVQIRMAPVPAQLQVARSARATSVPGRAGNCGRPAGNTNSLLPTWALRTPIWVSEVVPYTDLYQVRQGK